ncbi:protein CLEC16A homolog [Folsomia candida]|nr:protein CLEC16A homolog [Folsomia candida]
MFRSRSWFFSSSSSSSSTSLWKPKNPHSTEYLKYLHTVLTKNQTVTEQNKSLLVEALRSIAEILIWGDQNDPSVFDFFLEKNMLSFFLKIMKQNKCGSYVCVQLLQTLNILFENIRNQTSIYYLLSNNHVNSIIEHKFDFSDEEVMAYYISFLKTLSLKLNSQTIHFFYNEHTNDFPLYTEAIKFFNNSESMVRIAVRTLTLNVFRVDDKSMLKFIRDKTAAPYFSNLVWFIGNHVVEIDKLIKVVSEEGGEETFITTSSSKTTNITTQSQQKTLLDDLIAEHLDHLHYINDILLLKIEPLNEVLVDHLLNRLLRPVIVSSLITTTSPSSQPKISRILSLYLLTQIFSIVTHSALLTELLETVLATVDVLSFFDCSETDYLCFFVVTLLVAVERVKADNLLTNPTHLESFFFSELPYNPCLLQKLLAIIQTAVKSSTKIRIASLSLTTELILKITSKLQDSDLAMLESFREENILTLQNYFKTEEMFLEMFEDEYFVKGCDLESLLGDSCMLLPPVGSPLSGVNALEKRRPCGETERIRRSMRVYFLLRNLSLKLRGDEERYLPLSNIHRNTVTLEQTLDLTNSDLLACTVLTVTNTKETQKLRRFLVVDSFQIILVEPSQKRMGWGVVKFVGFLQDLDVQSDPSDTRCLHITVKSSPVLKKHSTLVIKQPILSAKFIFDDHIRCMAARQRLIKGRHRAREKKLTLISRALLNDNISAKYSPPQNLKSVNSTTSSSSARYQPIAKTLPGGVVVVGGASANRSRPSSASRSPRRKKPEDVIPMDAGENQPELLSPGNEIATTSFCIDKGSVFDV